MDTWIWVVIAAVVVAVIAIAGFLAWRQSRSARLRKQFGPEYERAVRETGDERSAERQLEMRRKRAESIELRPIDATDARRFADDWTVTQTRFVEDPSGAIGRADGLIGEVLELRGYPAADFDTRAGDLSVDHPGLVTKYRSAHDVAERNRRGQATTEELRRAMVTYREMFRELVEAAAPAGSVATAPDRPEPPARDDGEHRAPRGQRTRE